MFWFMFYLTNLLITACLSISVISDSYVSVGIKYFFGLLVSIQVAFFIAFGVPSLNGV